MDPFDAYAYCMHEAQQWRIGAARSLLQLAVDGLRLADKWDKRPLDETCVEWQLEQLRNLKEIAADGNEQLYLLTAAYKQTHKLQSQTGNRRVRHMIIVIKEAVYDTGKLLRMLEDHEYASQQIKQMAMSVESVNELKAKIQYLSGQLNGGLYAN